VRRLLLSPYALVISVAVTVAVLPLFLPTDFYLRVVALVFINALAVLGLNVLMGFAGQVSLGHAGFFGIGAYAVALGPTYLGLPSWASLIGGTVLSALIAFVVGRPILRLRGYYLAIATLGMGVWLAVNLIESPTGRALRAIHDSEIAARVLGVRVARYKLLAFVLSAAYASIAGSYFALFDGFVTPNAAGFLRSIEFVVMAVLGGLGSVLGSILGAAILVIVPQFLTVFHEFEHIVLGTAIVVLLIFLPDGIVPAATPLVRRRAT
jgi:branched-chain amino acid transport system permease protein